MPRRASRSAARCRPRPPTTAGWTHSPSGPGEQDACDDDARGRPWRASPHAVRVSGRLIQRRNARRMRRRVRRIVGMPGPTATPGPISPSTGRPAAPSATGEIVVTPRPDAAISMTRTLTRWRPYANVESAAMAWDTPHDPAIPLGEVVEAGLRSPGLGVAVGDRPERRPDALGDLDQVGRQVHAVPGRLVPTQAGFDEVVDRVRILTIERWIEVKGQRVPDRAHRSAASPRASPRSGRSPARRPRVSRSVPRFTLIHVHRFRMWYRHASVVRARGAVVGPTAGDHLGRMPDHRKEPDRRRPATRRSRPTAPGTHIERGSLTTTRGASSKTSDSQPGARRARAGVIALATRSNASGRESVAATTADSSSGCGTSPATSTRRSRRGCCRWP